MPQLTPEELKTMGKEVESESTDVICETLSSMKAIERVLQQELKRRNYLKIHEVC